MLANSESPANIFIDFNPYVNRIFPSTTRHTFDFGLIHFHRKQISSKTEYKTCELRISIRTLFTIKRLRKETNWSKPKVPRKGNACAVHVATRFTIRLIENLGALFKYGTIRHKLNTLKNDKFCSWLINLG